MKKDKLFLPLSSYEVTTNDDPTMETITLTIFVAGCVRKCIGCQNPELQEVNEKNHILLTMDQIKKLIENNLCLVKGIVFCGGDFLPLYLNQLKELIIFCKSLRLKTILYTGELFKNIDSYFQNNIDVIVDGPYDYSKKTNRFPASSNQRCWIDGKTVNCSDLEINQVKGG